MAPRGFGRRRTDSEEYRKSGREEELFLHSSLPGFLRRIVPALVVVLVTASTALAGDPKAPPAGPSAPLVESKSAKHFRERMEKFAAENEKLDPKRLYAVFVGDSITEGFPLERYFAGTPTLNRGIGADTTGAYGQRGVIRRLDESVFDCRPSVVFLQIGVNDLNGTGKPPEAIVRGVAAIIDAVRAKAPRLPIVLGTLLPTGEKYAHRLKLNPRIEAFNAGLAALAKERRLPLLDLHAAYRGEDGLLPAAITGDGLHIKRDAYGKWADLARPHIP
jgi:lysophospholipase L1-like esterase